MVSEPLCISKWGHSLALNHQFISGVLASPWGKEGAFFNQSLQLGYNLAFPSPNILNFHHSIGQNVELDTKQCLGMGRGEKGG